MRKAESTPSKLLLLPLIPALAFGIVELANHVSIPTATITVLEQPAPVKRVIEAPVPPPEPECRGCTLSF